MQILQTTTNEIIMKRHIKLIPSIPHPNPISRSMFSATTKAFASPVYYFKWISVTDLSFKIDEADSESSITFLLA